ncbi:MAG TPA: DUF3098 domain-containing protein [Cytophagaceae bacterium]|jgi:hypothetical protein
MKNISGFQYSKSSNTHIFSQRRNAVILIIGIVVLVIGFIIMSCDKQPYGYGFLGLTLGPLVVLAGFAIPIFAIFYGSNAKTPTGNRYDLWVNISGGFTFLIALAVYTICVEPTTSLWDCGEFIAASYKLQIPHPPGAPLFLLVGRIFSLFAPGKEYVAVAINMVSVLFSAFTILLLHASLALLAKKLLNITTVKSSHEALNIIGCSMVGSLTFAFSDSFWFNAEEAEVYAMSCFFTALVFWAILKWESQSDEPKSDRWIIFIAYMIGLSIGVHLLNLLAIPALAFIIYLKKYRPTLKGCFFTLILSLVLVGLIMNGIITGLPSLAGSMEVFFVNTLGLPFFSGIIFLFLLLLSAILCAIFYSINRDKRILNITVICFVFILIGYCSYILVLIRSNYNTPLDENNPEDVMSLILYLKRDQYGSRPLLKGPHFNAGYPEDVVRQSPRYRKSEEEGKYVVYDYDYEYIYNASQTMLFPRVYSTEPRHQQEYLKLLNLRAGKKPSMKDNLSFFINHQLGHMYGRYFLWNFVGRESDEQNAGWLSPAKWNEKDLPDLLKNNKARNNYYLLPLILGALGCFFHFKKNKHGAFVVLLLFFFTGLAIVIYLNQPPTEPRERDYTYVGSFYAFSIWVGIGVLYLSELIAKIIKHRPGSAILSSTLCFLVPSIMYAKNLDDHNRRGRYFAEDSARNILNSCAKNAILFTAADNDTFPLWFVQEVKDTRSDVRICNLSLLNMDWYIDCMKRKSNTSAPLPISLEQRNYIKGKNDQIYLLENSNLSKGIDLDKYLTLIKSENPLIRQPDRSGGEVTILPSSKVLLNINRNDVLKSHRLSSKLEPFVQNKMEFELKSGLGKSELILLDIIATNQWKRPIYFDLSALQDYPYLKKYTQKEGFVFRLLPAEVQSTSGWADSDLMYKNMVTYSSWRGLSSTSVYNDPAASPFISQSRMEFYKLAAQLYQECDKEKAKNVLLHSLRIMPDHVIPYDNTVLNYPALLFELDAPNTALEICDIFGKRSVQYLKYLSSKKDIGERELHLYVLQEIVQILKAVNRDKEAVIFQNVLEQVVNQIDE